jgi:hypothetical protein
MSFHDRLATTRATIGSMWGASTTHILAGIGSVQSLLMTTDPTLFGNKVIPMALFGVTLTAIFLRVTCPPAPSVPIEQGDQVTVHDGDNAVTIVKAEPITDPAICNKAAGQTVAAAKAAS